MGLELTVFAVLAAGTFLTMVLFLTFAQVTVRKLEKNPETKHALGFEFASGWRILNVANALVLPMGFFRSMGKTPLSSLYANAELLRRHTTRRDRIYAHLFFWPYVTTAIGLLFWVILHFSGFFEWYATL